MAAADLGQFESPDSDSSGGGSTTTSIQKDAAQPSNLYESSLSFVYEGDDEHATSKLSNALDCLVGPKNSSKIMATFTGELLECRTLKRYLCWAVNNRYISGSSSQIQLAFSDMKEAVIANDCDELTPLFTAIILPKYIKRAESAWLGAQESCQADLGEARSIRQARRAEQLAAQKARLTKQLAAQEARRAEELAAQEARLTKQLAAQEARRAEQLAAQKARLAAELANKKERLRMEGRKATARAAIKRVVEQQHEELKAMQAGSSGASLYQIHQVVHNGHSEDTNPESVRAVLLAFQWTREIYAAISGGSSTFEHYLAKVADTTTVDEQLFQGAMASRPQPWQNIAGEYHWIERAKNAPGRVVGALVQALDENGKWQAVENAAVGAAEQLPGTDMSRVRRVLVGYEMGSSADVVLQFAGLLVPVPAMLNNKTTQYKDKPEPRRLQSTPQEAIPQYAQIQGRTVHYIPIVLTLPRLHFLSRVAFNFQKGARGIQLTGVHGAGKSSMLMTLVSILSVGGKCDVMFSGDSSELEDLDINLVLRSAMHGSGELAAQLRDGVNSEAPIAFQTAWQKMVDKPDRNAAKAFIEGMKWGGVTRPSVRGGTQAAREQAPGETRNTEPPMNEPRVVVFDEVNKLLEKIAYHHPKPTETDSATFWREWLTWGFYGREGCFRILAASPHGKREEINGASTVPFELRPAPADHLAAILFCAPEYLARDGGAAATGLSLGDALEICEMLGGNARYIATFLGHLDEACSDQTQPSNVASAVQRTLHDVSGALLERFMKCYTPDKMEIDNLLKLAMLDASMVVRKHPCMGSATLLAGNPALVALLRAAAKILKGTSARLGVAKVLTENAFESAILMLASCGAVAKRRRLLSHMTHADNAEHKAENKAQPEVGHGVLGWSDGDKDGSTALFELFQSACDKKVLLSEGRKYLPPGSKSLQPISLLAGDFVCIASKLLWNHSPIRPNIGSIRRVFQTVDTFPGLDGVSVEINNDHGSVTMYEVTTSDLKTHSKKKSPTMQVYLVDGPHAGAKLHATVPVVVRDLAAVFGATKRTAERCSGTCVRLTEVDGGFDVPAKYVGDPAAAHEHEARDSIEHGTSVGNIVLAAAGIPIIVRRSVLLVDDTSMMQASDAATSSASVASGSGDPVLSAAGTAAASDTMSTERATYSTRSRAQAKPRTSSEARLTGKLAKLQLRYEVSPQLCNELHGEGNWETPGVRTWSLKFQYATNTELSSNYDMEYSCIAAKFVYAICQGDLQVEPKQPDK